MNKYLIKVAIVDDEDLLTELLAQNLEDMPGKPVSVIFVAAEGGQMQQQLELGNVPDVLLMDLRMKGMDGYQSTRWLRKQYPDIKVLAMSAFDNEDAILDILACGACGFITKKARSRQIVEAILEVHGKGIYYNDYVTPALLRKAKERAERTGSTQLLNERRMEFLRLYCQDISLKTIGERMCLSEHTIKHMGDRLQENFGVHSRHAVVHKAHGMGLITS